MGEGVKKQRAKAHRQAIDKAGGTGIYEANLFSGMPVAEGIFVECELLPESDAPSQGDRVNLIDRGKARVEVFRSTTRIGLVSVEGTRLLRDEQGIAGEPGKRISGFVGNVAEAWLSFTVGIYLKT
jgi:hypothetical protein